jgi:hypothetical protein
MSRALPIGHNWGVADRPSCVAARQKALETAERPPIWTASQLWHNSCLPRGCAGPSHDSRQHPCPCVGPNLSSVRLGPKPRRPAYRRSRKPSRSAGHRTRYRLAGAPLDGRMTPPFAAMRKRLSHAKNHRNKARAPARQGRHQSCLAAGKSRIFIPGWAHMGPTGRVDA